MSGRPSGLPASNPPKTRKDQGAAGASGPSAIPRGARPAPKAKPATLNPTTPPVAATSDRPATLPGGVQRFPIPADFDAFFKGVPDVSEAQIYLDVAELRGRKDFARIEACLSAYLKYHGKHAKAWMYEQLATAMEINKRDPASIKTSFGWAAYLAMKTSDPVVLIAAADALLLHKYEEIELPGVSKIKASAVLDKALDVAPHRPEPLFMSLLMAERHRDPKRMGDTMERLLSLGWPGTDDAWRAEVRRRVTTLAKYLREEGRGDEARSMLDRLPEAETRDVVIRLTWSGDAMLELAVDEPLGVTAEHFMPRTVFGGALVKEGTTRDPESVYTCPRGFDGDYVAHVRILYNDEKKPVKIATLELIAHEGAPNEERKTVPVSLSKLDPVPISLASGRRKAVLPYEPPTLLKVPIAPKPDPAKPDDKAKDARLKP